MNLYDDRYLLNLEADYEFGLITMSLKINGKINLLRRIKSALRLVFDNYIGHGALELSYNSVINMINWLEENTILPDHNNTYVPVTAIHHDGEMHVLISCCCHEEILRVRLYDKAALMQHNDYGLELSILSTSMHNGSIIKRLWDAVKFITGRDITYQEILLTHDTKNYLYKYLKEATCHTEEESR